MGIYLSINMLATSIISFSILALDFVDGGFVKKISETDYELNFDERGALFTQKVSLDTEHNLVITEVPAHHNRVAITYIYDSSNGLGFTIFPSAKKCEINRPFIALDGNAQKANLDNAASDDSLGERLVVNSQNTSPYEFARIEGPEVGLYCVPKNFRKFVP